jgi:hypothetical protein
MGVAFIALIVSTGGWPGIEVSAFLTLSSAITFGIPLWMALRLCGSIRARRDQQAGTLRQGVLVGPEGLLVRLTPNCCRVVLMDRFVTAKEWSGGGEEGTGWLTIETKDGPLDLLAGSLAVGSAAVNQAVAATRRHGR